MSAVRRLSKAVENATTYLFNYTNEELAPGDILGLDSDGALHKLGTIVELLAPADQPRAIASINGPGSDYTEMQTVQQGLQIAVKMSAEGSGAVGPAVAGKASGKISFGIGGGCFLDVSAAARVALLGADRVWLLKQAAAKLAPGQMMIEEVVSAAYVASATSGWTSELGLSVDATVDPGSVGLGTLGELKAAGKLEVTIQSGKVFLKQPSQGRPLFRAITAEDLVDLTKSAANALDGLHFSMDLKSIAGAPGVVKTRIVRQVTTDDLATFYAIDDD